MKTPAIVSLLLALSAGAAQAADKVPVHAITKSVTVSEGSKVDGLDLDIRRGGRTAYELKCHSGSSDSDFPDYSGLIQCYLFDTAQRGRVNLLAEPPHGQRVWDNRARFLTGHVYPACAKSPQWGAVREFRMQGMRITLSVSKPVFKRAQEPASKDDNPWF